MSRGSWARRRETAAGLLGVLWLAALGAAVWLRPLVVAALGASASVCALIAALLAVSGETGSACLAGVVAAVCAVVGLRLRLRDAFARPVGRGGAR